VLLEARLVFIKTKNDNLKPFSISATEAEYCLEIKEKNHFSLSQIRIAFRQTDWHEFLK